MGGSQQYGQMDAAPTYAAPSSGYAPANQGYAPANQGYAAPAPQPARPAVSTPPSADVYDEDIPF
jgi:single-strand DNA-binding protein